MVGSGVKKDTEMAEKWLKKAAKAGLVEAQLNYAQCCEILGDTEKAVHWYQEAAKQGDFKARVRLAECYNSGIGVEKNPEQAAYWCEEAERNKADAAEDK